MRKKAKTTRDQHEEHNIPTTTATTKKPTVIKKLKETRKRACIRIMRNLFVQNHGGEKPAHVKYATAFYRMLDSSHCCRNLTLRSKTTTLPTSCLSLSESWRGRMTVVTWIADSALPV